MVFQRCSDVAEPRVEQAILDAESHRNAASTSDSEQPRRASPYARELLRRLAAASRPLYRPVRRLVNRSDHRDGVTKIDNRIIGDGEVVAICS
jgi:hypothetical protein